MQREKQLSRWNNGFNSTKYSKLIRSKKNVQLDDKKVKQLSELSLSTAPSNKSKMDQEPRGRKLYQDGTLKNNSF